MKDIRTYDFSKTQQFSNALVKFFVNSSADFCKLANLQLLHELGQQTLKFSKNSYKQLQYSEFLDSLVYDSLIMNLQIEATGEYGVLTMSKATALMLSETLLGGNPRLENFNRDISLIDIDVLLYFINLLFENLGQSTLLKMKVTDVYTNTALYKNSKTQETSFVSSIDISMENVTLGSVDLCIPHNSISREFIDMVESSNKSHQDDSTVDISCEEQMINILNENNVSLEVVAELGSSKIRAGELLELSKDDIIILNRKVTEDIDISVAGSKAYKAMPGISGSKNAVLIKNTIEGDA